MKVLPMNFYTMPQYASTTMDKEDLKEILLETGGNILACGSLYDIETKSLGAGVYRVFLRRTY